MENNIATFVVDWGTSNFRLFGIDSKGALIDTIEAPMGLLQIKDSKFAEALEPKLKAMTPSYHYIPVLMAGMVGSASGWKEVPYVAAPASVSDVAQNAVCFDLPWGAQARILPGVSYRCYFELFDFFYRRALRIVKPLLIGKTSFAGSGNCR